ncbi:MAG: NfeD family protein, partial [Acidimicrobiia bacterium]
PGVAALVAALAFFPAGYGLAVLPVRLWAVGMALAGLLMLAAAFQRGGRSVVGLGGLAMLAVAGASLTDAAPQLRPTWWGVLLTVAVAAFFYLLALPAVARARFSAPTMGRDHLVGRHGRAVTDLRPEGLVEVDGAQWRATSRREAGIRAEDKVVVRAVAGLRLEVEPRQSAKSSP